MPQRKNNTCSVGSEWWCAIAKTSVWPKTNYTQWGSSVISNNKNIISNQIWTIQVIQVIQVQVQAISYSISFWVTAPLHCQSLPTWRRQYYQGTILPEPVAQLHGGKMVTYYVKLVGTEEWFRLVVGENSEPMTMAMAHNQDTTRMWSSALITALCSCIAQSSSIYVWAKKSMLSIVASPRNVVARSGCSATLKKVLLVHGWLLGTGKPYQTFIACAC